ASVEAVATLVGGMLIGHVRTLFARPTAGRGVSVFQIKALLGIEPACGQIHAGLIHEFGRHPARFVLASGLYVKPQRRVTDWKTKPHIGPAELITRIIARTSLAIVTPDHSIPERGPALRPT